MSEGSGGGRGAEGEMADAPYVNANGEAAAAVPDGKDGGRIAVLLLTDLVYAGVFLMTFTEIGCRLRACRLPRVERAACVCRCGCGRGRPTAVRLTDWDAVSQTARPRSDGSGHALISRSSRSLSVCS